MQAILQWIGQTFRQAEVLIYEQVYPHDPFGQAMVENLQVRELLAATVSSDDSSMGRQERGCSLRSLHQYPDLASQERRFADAGFDTARALTMNDVYSQFLPRDDVRRCPPQRLGPAHTGARASRAEKLEMFDELEEWLAALTGCRRAHGWEAQVPHPGPLLHGGRYAGRHCKSLPVFIKQRRRSCARRGGATADGRAGAAVACDKRRLIRMTQGALAARAMASEQCGELAT